MFIRGQPIPDEYWRLLNVVELNRRIDIYSKSLLTPGVPLERVFPHVNFSTHELLLTEHFLFRLSLLLLRYFAPIGATRG